MGRADEPGAWPGIATATVKVGGVPTFVRATGSHDGPALVLLHGLPTSSWLWRHCLPALALARPEWRIIAPDLPGYGRSGARAGAGPRDLGRWLHALLATLGVGRFVLVGHDLGGLIALTDAVTRATDLGHPARLGGPQFDRLLLLDTTIYPVPRLVLGLVPTLVPPLAELSLLWLGRGGTARDNQRRAFYISGLQALLEPGSALSDDEWAEYALPYGSLAGWREATRSIRALAPQAPFVLRCLAQLRHLTVPTRLIWGAGDPFFPLATAERLRRAIPGAEEQVHVIAGAGHFPQEDRPDEVARLIADFLPQR